MENAHLLRYLIPRHCGVLLCTPHSSGFVRRRRGLPALFARVPVSEALYLGIFHQPLEGSVFRQDPSAASGGPTNSVGGNQSDE